MFMGPVDPGLKEKETGERIRKLMDENGFTVKDIQEAMGFEHPQAIYKWLRGETIPRIDNLVILSIVFHTTVDDILAKGGDSNFIKNFFNHNNLCLLFL